MPTICRTLSILWEYSEERPPLRMSSESELECGCVLHINLLTSALPKTPLSSFLSQSGQPAALGQRANRQLGPDAQVVLLSVALLRFESSEGETPAKLALISSLHKRLCSLPGELVADAMWHVRLHNKHNVSGPSNRLL